MADKLTDAEIATLENFARLSKDGNHPEWLQWGRANATEVEKLSALVGRAISELRESRKHGDGEGKR
jgi:hypothetical protein